MNLNDLKNFDINSLRNFKIEDLRNFINEHQVLAFNFAIGAGALIICFFLGSGRLEEYGQLKSRMDDLLSKEEPVRKYEKTLKRSNDLQSAIPAGLSEADMISYLTLAASGHKAVIGEFKPPVGLGESFYSEAKVSFSCSVPDFREAIGLMHELENSENLIKINSWSITPVQAQPQGRGRSRAAPVEEGIRSSAGFSMDIDVSSIQLTENDKRKQKKE